MNLKKALLLLGAVLVWLSYAASSTDAQWVRIGVGVPIYRPYPYYPPSYFRPYYPYRYPLYVAPPPVYVARPPAYYYAQPAPVIRPNYYSYPLPEATSIPTPPAPSTLPIAPPTRSTPLPPQPMTPATPPALLTPPTPSIPPSSSAPPALTMPTPQSIPALPDPAPAAKPVDRQ